MTTLPIFLRRDLANHSESLPSMLMARLPLIDDDAGQRRLQVDVPVIDVRLQVALVLGAKRTMGATEGRRLAAFIQQVPLQDVRVLVALAAS